MPAYSRDGTAEIAWASQKRYISLYVMRADVLNAHRGQLSGLDVGKGCIRYRSPAAVDFTVVHSLLTAVAASRGPVCSTVPPPLSRVHLWRQMSVKAGTFNAARAELPHHSPVGSMRPDDLRAEAHVVALGLIARVGRSAAYCRARSRSEDA